MKPVRAAVISLTGRGRHLSEKIAASGVCVCERFCFEKHTDPDAQAFSDMSRLTAGIFGRFDALIFVCACGIAVRMIAPHVRSKLTDPAVIAVDDCGRFAVPLLSGHLGGANALAQRLAEVISATAVVTTATDTGRLFSPDSFAAANGLTITDMDAAKLIASAVLDGERIGLVSDCEYVNLPDQLTTGTARCGIYIGTRGLKPFEVTLTLVPRDLAVGIGCKRGTSAEKIAAAVAAAGIDRERIAVVASIDLKAAEPGLIGFCAERRLPFVTFTADELRAAGGEFTASEFVGQVTGVDNVCERSAVLAGGGELLIRKTVLDGVTAAAAAKRAVLLDFSREM